MPTVTSKNKAEFDREFMEQKGILKKEKKEKLKSKYLIKPHYDENEKRSGYGIWEGDYVHDIYPTKKYAQELVKRWESQG